MLSKKLVSHNTGMVVASLRNNGLSMQTSTPSHPRKSIHTFYHIIHMLFGRLLTCGDGTESTQSITGQVAQQATYCCHISLVYRFRLQHATCIFTESISLAECFAEKYQHMTGILRKDLYDNTATTAAAVSKQSYTDNTVTILYIIGHSMEGKRTAP